MLVKACDSNSQTERALAIDILLNCTFRRSVDWRDEWRESAALLRLVGGTEDSAERRGVRWVDVRTTLEFVAAKIKNEKAENKIPILEKLRASIDEQLDLAARSVADAREFVVIWAGILQAVLEAMSPGENGSMEEIIEHVALALCRRVSTADAAAVSGSTASDGDTGEDVPVETAEAVLLLGGTKMLYDLECHREGTASANKRFVINLAPDGSTLRAATAQAGKAQAERYESGTPMDRLGAF